MNYLPNSLFVALLVAPLLGMGMMLYFRQRDLAFLKAFDFRQRIIAWAKLLYPIRNPAIYILDSEDAGRGYGPTILKQPVISHSMWVDGNIEEGYMTFINVPLGSFAVLEQKPSNTASRILSTSQWCFFDIRHKRNEAPITVNLLPQSMRWQLLLNSTDRAMRIGSFPFKFHVSIHSQLGGSESDVQKIDSIAKSLLQELDAYRGQLRGCISLAIQEYIAELSSKMKGVRDEDIARRFVAEMPELASFCSQRWKESQAASSLPLVSCLTSTVSCVVVKVPHQVLQKQYYIRRQQTDAIDEELRAIAHEIERVTALAQRVMGPFDQIISELLPKLVKHGDELVKDCNTVQEFLVNAQVGQALHQTIVQPHQKSSSEFKKLVKDFNARCDELAKAIVEVEKEQRRSFQQPS